MSANVIIKGDERRAAEAQTLREYGIDPRTASREQREYAERITADNREAASQFNRMEEMSK